MVRQPTEACSDYKSIYVEVVRVYATSSFMTDGVVCEFSLELLDHLRSVEYRYIAHGYFFMR